MCGLGWVSLFAFVYTISGHYWSLPVIWRVVLGLVHERMERGRVKITTKQRISTLWALGVSCSPPEPRCVLLRLTPDFSCIQFRLRDAGEEQMANLPLVQWYFKSGVLPDYPAAIYSREPRYKLHAFGPGLPVVFSVRDELSVLISSYLESSCLFYYLSLVHLYLPLLLPSDRLIFSHEISGLLTHYFNMVFDP